MANNSYLTKVKKQMMLSGLSGKSAKKTADGHSNSKKGKNMDIIVKVAVAILIAIIAVLIAIITKKTIKKIFIFAILGMI